MKRMAIPTLIMVMATAAALWQGRLDLGMVLFMAMGLASGLIRSGISDESPLPISRTVADQRETILTTLVAAGMIWVPIIYVATPLLDVASYGRGAWMSLFGLPFACLGLWLFFRAHTDLGRNWSPRLEVRKGHALVTGGIYGRMRHPMYTAIFAIGIAQAMFLPNLIAGPAGLIFFTLLYLVRIDDEEALMADVFGTEWNEYAGRTPRLLPVSKR